MRERSRRHGDTERASHTWLCIEFSTRWSAAVRFKQQRDVHLHGSFVFVKKFLLFYINKNIKIYNINAATATSALASSAP